MRGLLGSELGIIFQDPLPSLHPFYSIGAQISGVSTWFTTGF